MDARFILREGLALVLTLSILLLVGCSGESLTSTEAEISEARTLGFTAEKQAQIQAGLDVSGSWSWSREEHLTFPEWVAQTVLGILPEGPTTTARCEGSGTMTLAQVGASLTGSFEQTAHECVTKGGQVFQDPGAFSPVAITDGELHGRSLSILLDGVLIDCRYHAVAKDVEGNTAVTLDGGGSCIVPGHPKSEIGLDPPPGGTSKTLSFTAVRQ